jgi:hypothetical protein
MKISDPEKLTLLYERFRDVCLVEKEVWHEIFLPRETKGMVLTNLQDRYDVIIEDRDVEEALEATIPLGKQALDAAIQQYRDHIGFVKKS